MDEIDDPEFLDFAIENIDELLSYIESGRINIRIHRDITGEMWFGYMCWIDFSIWFYENLSEYE
ncbi:MAG: hypothetical protein GY797_20970 [Deltaproteobacteria bacterium]|nr:hypothetical protein [Deltaproteobacteria bacterium]